VAGLQTAITMFALIGLVLGVLIPRRPAEAGQPAEPAAGHGAAITPGG
jgi:hypothetical protein